MACSIYQIDAFTNEIFGGNPAADGMSGQNITVQTQLRDQVLSKVGHIGDGIQPFRPGSAEHSRNRRGIHCEALRQWAGGGVIGAEPLSAMEE